MKGDNNGNLRTTQSDVLSISFRDDRLYFLDQTRLPEESVQEEQSSAEQVWDSIKRLKVRGAPAIGIAGAYGLYIGARRQLQTEPRMTADAFISQIEKTAAYLDSARPTAVNLSWALKRMIAAARAAAFATSAHPAAAPAAAAPAAGSVERILAALRTEAELIHEEDRQLCRGIGKAGLTLVREGIGILTHCNAGALATSILGTVTAPLYLAHQNGINFRVYADETRPLLQGARLTSWELDQGGIDVTLICDNMAASLMATGKVDIVLVGTDRVAANGDVANKIGTYGVALLARHFDIPFYVACPSSTVDFDTATGSLITIEERDPEEVRFFGARRIAPEQVKVWNPAFDVTPNEFVTGIITERGILRPPYADSLRTLRR